MASASLDGGIVASTHTAVRACPRDRARRRSIHERRPWPAARSATRDADGKAASIRVATAQASNSSLRGRHAAELTASATSPSSGGSDAKCGASRGVSFEREPTRKVPTRRSGGAAARTMVRGQISQSNLEAS